MLALRARHAFDGYRFLPGGATLLVEDGLVVSLEPGSVDPPDGVGVTAYEGTLLPGLIECHTHLVADATFGSLERVASMSDDALDAVVLASLVQHAAAGETTVRDLGDRGYRTLAFRDRPGLPRVVAGGPPITTVRGHCHFLGGAVTTDGAGAVAERVTHGVDVIKVMASGGFATEGTDPLGSQFDVPELAEIVTAAHRAGLPVVAHAHSMAGMRNAVAAGVDGIEHFSGLTADGPRLDLELLDEVARRGIAIDLTMGNDRSMHARMPDPPPSVAALMTGLGVTSFDQFYALRIGELATYREHGVTLVTGVDSGMLPMKRHGSVWRVVLEMVEGGYPSEEALAAATSGAAAACRLEGRTGVLAPGYAADVLVVDGDLSQDLSALGRPSAVLIRGTPASVGQVTV